MSTAIGSDSVLRCEQGHTPRKIYRYQRYLVNGISWQRTLPRLGARSFEGQLRRPWAAGSQLCLSSHGPAGEKRSDSTTYKSTGVDMRECTALQPHNFVPRREPAGSFKSTKTPGVALFFTPATERVFVTTRAATGRSRVPGGRGVHRYYHRGYGVGGKHPPR